MKKIEESRTRWQIMGSGAHHKRPIENFTAAQAKECRARREELTALGVTFTVWDTQHNSLSRMFRL